MGLSEAAPLSFCTVLWAFQAWGPCISSSLGQKKPLTVSKNEKCRFLSLLSILVKSLLEVLSVSLFKHAWKICLGGMADWEWPFASDVSSVGGVSPASLKNCNLYLLNRLRGQFWNCFFLDLWTVYKGRCPTRAVLFRLLKLGMLISYVVFRIITSEGMHNAIKVT